MRFTEAATDLYKNVKKEAEATGAIPKPKPASKPAAKKQRKVAVSFELNGKTHDLEWMGDGSDEEITRIVQGVKDSLGVGEYSDRFLPAGGGKDDAPTPMPMGNRRVPKTKSIGPQFPSQRGAELGATGVRADQRVSIEEINARELKATPTEDLIKELARGPDQRTSAKQERYRAVIDELQDRATTAGKNVKLGPLLGVTGGLDIGGVTDAGHLAGLLSGMLLEPAETGASLGKASANGNLDVRDRINILAASPQAGAALGAVGKKVLEKGGELAAKRSAKTGITPPVTKTGTKAALPREAPPMQVAQPTQMPGFTGTTRRSVLEPKVPSVLDEVLGEPKVQPASYQTGHRPMTVESGAATADDIAKAFGDEAYKPKLLRQYYGTGADGEDDVIRILQSLKGKPDAMVTIYRGVGPDDPRVINEGDWITLHRGTAEEYANIYAAKDGRKGDVVAMQVPASHVTVWADSLLEQGYYPPKSASKAVQPVEQMPKSQPSVLDEVLGIAPENAPVRPVETPQSAGAGVEPDAQTVTHTFKTQSEVVAAQDAGLLKPGDTVKMPDDDRIWTVNENGTPTTNTPRTQTVTPNRGIVSVTPSTVKRKRFDDVAMEDVDAEFESLKLKDASGGETTLIKGDDGIWDVNSIHAARVGEGLERKKGQGTYATLVDWLESQGILEFRVSNQSKDSRAVLSKMVADGRLEASEVSGLSVDQHPKRFKIVPNKTADAPSTPTSARQADINADREALGKAGFSTDDVRKWSELEAKANPNAVPKDDNGYKTGAWTDQETVNATAKLRELKTQIEALRKSGDDPETLVTLEDEFDQLTEAMYRSGTEQGRALAARRYTMDVASLPDRYKARGAVKGWKVDPKRLEELEQIAKDYKALKEQIDRKNPLDIDALTPNDPRLDPMHYDGLTDSSLYDPEFVNRAYVELFGELPDDLPLEARAKAVREGLQERINRAIEEDVRAANVETLRDVRQWFRDARGGDGTSGWNIAVPGRNPGQWVAGPRVRMIDTQEIPPEYLQMFLDWLPTRNKGAEKYIRNGSTQDVNNRGMMGTVADFDELIDRDGSRGVIPQSVVDEFVRDLGRQIGDDAGEVVVRRQRRVHLDSEFDDLLSEFKKAALSSAHTGIPPELIPIVGKMVANRIKAGAASIEDIVIAIQKKFRERLLDPPERQDIIDAYAEYKATAKPEPNERAQKLREKRSKIEKEMREESTQRKSKYVADAEAKAKRAAEAAEERARKAAEKQQRIEANQKARADEKAKARAEREAADAEAKALREEQERILGERKDWDKRNADKKRELERLNARIAELEAGEEPKARQKRFENDPEIQALRGQVQTVKVQRAIEKRIAELEKSIEAGTGMGPKARKLRPEDLDTLRLRNRMETLRKRAKQIYDSQQPVTTGQRMSDYITEGKLLNPVARVLDLASGIGTIINRTLIDGNVSALTSALSKDARVGSMLEPAKIQRVVTLMRSSDMWRQWVAEGMHGTRGIGGKMAAASDIPARMFLYHVSLDDMAFNIARRELGKAPKEQITRRALELLQNPTDEMMETATAEMLAGTYNSRSALSKGLTAAKRTVESGIRGGENVGGRAVAADTFTLVFDSLTRFSNVIGNVVKDRAMRTLNIGGIPVSSVAAVAQAGFKTAKKIPMSSAERRGLQALFAKGATGTALMYLGYNYGRELGIVPQVMRNTEDDDTDPGTPFVEQEGVTGVIEQVGGIFSPFLYGATLREIEDADITDNMKRDLRNRVLMDLTTSLPATGGMEKVAGVLSGRTGLEDFIGGTLIANQIPAPVKVGAERLDAYQTTGNVFGQTPKRRAKPTKEDAFWEALLKPAKRNVPGLRGTLPEQKQKNVTRGF